MYHSKGVSFICMLTIHSFFFFNHQAFESYLMSIHHLTYELFHHAFLLIQNRTQSAVLYL